MDAGYAADQGAPGDRRAGHRHARRGDEDADVARRSATSCSGSARPRTRLRPRHDLGLALRAEGEPGPVARAVRRRRPRPRASRRRTSSGCKKQQLAAIQREKAQPFAMALRVFPRCSTARATPTPAAHRVGHEGDGRRAHPRGRSSSSTQTWFKPNNATLVVVGDTTLAEIQPKLEGLFASWKPGEVPKKNVAPVGPGAASGGLPHRPPGRAAVGDHRRPRGPAAQQPRRDRHQRDEHHPRRPVHLAAQHEPPRGQALDLRRADALPRRPRASGRSSPTPRSRPTRRRSRWRRSSRSSGHRSASGRSRQDELETAKDDLTLTLPGQWETADAVRGSIGEMVRFGFRRPTTSTATRPRCAPRRRRTSRGRAKKPCNPGSWSG